MRTITLIFGGQEYEVPELRTLEADEWRIKLRGPFAELVAMLRYSTVIDIKNIRQVSALLEHAILHVSNSTQLIRDLVFAYHPVLEQSKDDILANSYDEDFYIALKELLKRAYPFGTLLATFQPIGPVNSSTGQKSASPNGASGTRILNRKP